MTRSQGGFLLTATTTCRSAHQMPAALQQHRLASLRAANQRFLRLIGTLRGLSTGGPHPAATGAVDEALEGLTRCLQVMALPISSGTHSPQLSTYFLFAGLDYRPKKKPKAATGACSMEAGWNIPCAVLNKHGPGNWQTSKTFYGETEAA